mmetsp:Transcript_71567/g.127544  ORF Transcript_71567/g.127544 Transcript_71567/m.127544 type:complete len:406 (+) Transcript_71567:118-1335(+)
MITYDHRDTTKIVFQLTGSVLPKTWPLAVFSLVVSTTLSVLRRAKLTAEIFSIEDYIEDPLSIGIIGAIMGYLLVMRTNMALDRWMSGISEVQSMLQKWEAAYNCLNGFFSGKQGPPETMDRIHFFRVRIAHWFSLMSCLAFASLRMGHESSLADVPIHAKFPAGSRRRSFASCKSDEAGDMDEAAESARRKGEKIFLVRSLDLKTLHNPTPDEVRALEASSDKVHTLCLWIIQAIMIEVRAGTLDAPPPIVTRIFQEISSGMLGYHQALKISHVPFPFPFAQMVTLLLSFMYVCLPLYIDVFTKSLVLTPVISTLLSTSFCSLNLISIELEAPFGMDSNDIDIQERHEAFMNKLEDVLRSPMAPPVSAANRLEMEIQEGHDYLVKAEERQLADGAKASSRKSSQ